MDATTLNRVAQLERHIDWLNRNLGPSEVHDKRLAEISVLRAEVANATSSKLFSLCCKMKMM
jgi:hypothetical protein